MLRGYRGILAALAGLTLLGANHAYAESGGKEPQAHQSVEASFQNISSAIGNLSERAKAADQEEQPCGPKQYGSHADLCAQWKAADAAADSAWWAWLGGLVGFGSLIGVFVALGLAFHSNWIARDTARRQLRAYISVSDISFEAERGDKPHNLQGVVSFKNTGQTPAIDLDARLWIAVSAGSRLDRMPIIEHPLDGPTSKAILGAGLSQQISHVTEITGHTAAEVLSGDFTIVAHGYIRYRDVFGAVQETRYKSFQNINTRKGGTPVCSWPDGNSMT